ncbi:MAG: hypothetical protein CMM18_03165 [Rhodospirillaceae bacterium]|nr:hypothetical protein [Rhodospirillaceae bacterium]|tara:strand:- start:1004 stop:1384 length:381 start_codon:yes stop_codon:yes gene_type:complete
MNVIKYIIEILLILVLFGVSTTKANTLTIFCNEPSYFKWIGSKENWQDQKNPIYREMTIQINFDLLRSRVKYHDKWYSWAYATFEKDEIKWKYSAKFSYKYDLSKNQLIEKQNELLLKYINCRSTF